MNMSERINCAIVGYCPVCGQGRQLVVKAKSSGELFVYCEECESRWASPMAARYPDHVLLPWSPLAHFAVSVHELRDHPWMSYVTNQS
jgi:hypothetical protein